jgi:outer membrane protein assembly factor BamE (lipoprotein component of BamABCDE complex)
MKRLFALVLMAFSICFSYGCAPVMTSGTPAIKNDNVMNQIKLGITDKTTVYQLLGAPMAAHNSPSGEVWMYHYSEMNRKLHLIGWRGLFDTTLDAQSTMINITFDDHDVIKAISGRPINLTTQKDSSPTTGFQQALHSKTQVNSAPKVGQKSESQGMDPIQ